MFKLFGEKSKIRENRYLGEIRATQDGVAVSLAEVPDDAIRNGILGEGVAIIPRIGKVVSPVDGTITSIARSRHAFCIQTSDGVDVLIHIGVDTVKLKGQGFRIHVKEGGYVFAGAPICDVDLSLLEEKNLSTHTSIIISNPADFKEITSILGDVVAGVSTIMQYKTKEDEQEGGNYGTV